MSQHYSDPSRASDPHTLPDVEVFYRDAEPARGDHDDGWDAGWYYWYCSPGCMPDSEASGPYVSEEKAVEAMYDEVSE